MFNVSNMFDYVFLKYLKKKLNVFIFIGCVIAAAIFLLNLNKQGYNIFVEFNNAYRIKKGTNVNLQGVLIGSVDTITIRSNKVIILLHINSINILIPRNSVIEANQIGLFNDIVIDITPPNKYKRIFNINPKSSECINSSFVCANFYLKGYKGINYDDLVRATTRISQRFDDPRFFSLFYLMLHNLVDISDEIFYCIRCISSLVYLFGNSTTAMFLYYFM